MIIGIDAGSVSLGVVVLNEKHEITAAHYIFHQGKIRECLETVINTLDGQHIQAIGCTSSTPEIIKSALIVNNRVAYIGAATHFQQQLNGLLILGAEQFGLALFDQGKFMNYYSNTSCAAGTGSFLDQQAKRLNMQSMQEFCDAAEKNIGAFPMIATRCAVFAKTDLIHAQQEGYTTGQIADGLCYGLAKNITDTLFSSSNCKSPVIAAGGVSLNKVVLKHISSITGLDILAHPYSHLFGAIGAALHTSSQTHPEKPQLIINKEVLQKTLFHEPLKLKHSYYPDFSKHTSFTFESALFKGFKGVETDLYEIPKSGFKYSCLIGIDIGSTSTKAVLLDEKKNSLAAFYTRTSGQPITAVQVIFETIAYLEEKYKCIYTIEHAATTGSGRKFIGKIIGAELILDEITAHARAACQLDPEIDTIIEIGGQDAKFTTLSKGSVTFSFMNQVCAAGTGSFIEEQASRLGYGVREVSALAENSASPLTSDRCTVFMERDLNAFMSDGYSTNEIMASVLHAVRDNYLGKVATVKNIGKKITFQGATAKIKALVCAFEQKLNKPIYVSPFCHVTGAMGAAIELMEMLPTEKTFRGKNIFNDNIELSSEVCELCNNHCKIKIADIGKERVAFGFLCGRDYDNNNYVPLDKGEFQLIPSYRKISAVKNSGQYAITIGLPESLHMFDEIPLWKKFFANLNIKTSSKKSQKNAIKAGKLLTGAEFCAPITALHSHVADLLDHCNYIFLPIYLETEKENNVRKNYCYYTQFAPSMIATLPTFPTERFLIPNLRNLEKPSYVINSLTQMLNTIFENKYSKSMVKEAYLDAENTLKKQNKEWKKLFNKHYNENETQVMILGRPYSVLDPDMNNHIPDIFEKMGITCFFQNMIDHDKEISPYAQNMVDSLQWKYASHIIRVADFVAQKKGLYPVFITSFKCTPDAFAVEYFRQLMDYHKKPYLVLQLDEHDSSLGYETRIESAVRSFRNHFAQPNQTQKIDRHFSNVFLKKKKALQGKTLLLPCWDYGVCYLLEASFRNAGVDARLMIDSPDRIKKSISLNTGQCLPLSIITQNYIDYIEEHKLDPASTALWMMESYLSCNLHQFPAYIKKLLNDKSDSLAKTDVYIGQMSLHEIGLKTSINAYLSYMFSGYIRKIGCRIRPYETIKGLTDKVIQESLDRLYDTILHNKEVKPALEEIISAFENIPIKKEKRPKVAIFGDLYVRDNDVLNQNIIHLIEEHGGEAYPTTFTEFLKITSGATLDRMYYENLYMDAFILQSLRKFVPPIYEKMYFPYFNRILQEPPTVWCNGQDEQLKKVKMDYRMAGESVENVLKLINLAERYPEIVLFIQTNPSYCCPSLITEGMSAHIERLTGIPIISIEYDGTEGNKNEDLIPYLKFRNAN